jgi:hypothetical protein
VRTSSTTDAGDVMSDDDWYKAHRPPAPPRHLQPGRGSCSSSAIGHARILCEAPRPRQDVRRGGAVPSERRVRDRPAIRSNHGSIRRGVCIVAGGVTHHFPCRYDSDSSASRVFSRVSAMPAPIAGRSTLNPRMCPTAPGRARPRRCDVAGCRDARSTSGRAHIATTPDRCPTGRTCPARYLTRVGPHDPECPA